MMKHIPLVAMVVLFAALMSPAPALAAPSMEIWPADSPELQGVKPEHIPHLLLHSVAPATEAKRPAVLILPAGGYKFHSDMSKYVKWLNGIGIAVFEVKYRLPAFGYKHPAPLHDAQRSMRLIRLNAEKWGVDPERVGILGVSSGGHVASTLATHFDRGDKDATDPIDRMSCRPDFVFMKDAVVTMQGKFCHTPSRSRLLPEEPAKELVDLLSNELQVTADTPPTFLQAGGQDRLVPADNSLMFFIALRKHNVTFSELHFTSHGGHGYTDIDFSDEGTAWLTRLGIIGDAMKDERMKKSLTDKGAWASDNE